MLEMIVYDSPLGALTLAAGELGMRELRFGARATPGGRPELARKQAVHVGLIGAIEQLDAYFAGELHRFELGLDLGGTPFQRRVWAALAEIPYGTTTTYGALARELSLPGHPAEPRALGGCVGRTPVPIVIPCHRVIGADGSLTGYGGGLDRKRALLAFEAAGGKRTVLDATWGERQLALL